MSIALGLLWVKASLRSKLFTYIIGLNLQMGWGWGPFHGITPWRNPRLTEGSGWVQAAELVAYWVLVRPLVCVFGGVGMSTVQGFRRGPHSLLRGCRGLGLTPVRRREKA